MGHLIGTFTINGLRFIFCFKKGHYEFDSIKSFYGIKNLILQDKENLRDDEKLYAFVTFDHDYLPSNIHSWVQRRWIAFHTSANTVTGIILSVFLGLCFFKIKFLTYWPLVCLFFIVLFTLHAYNARKETIEMVMFQTKVKPKKSKDDKSGEK
ncbi:MAG TPA: hypothetical protein VK174_05020 [Chitinophagales bacterium]|nr:hypothetical protein [Chitinophagales bacterium]